MELSTKEQLLARGIDVDTYERLLEDPEDGSTSTAFLENILLALTFTDIQAIANASPALSRWMDRTLGAQFWLTLLFADFWNNSEYDFDQAGPFVNGNHWQTLAATCKYCVDVIMTTLNRDARERADIDWHWGTTDPLSYTIKSKYATLYTYGHVMASIVYKMQRLSLPSYLITTVDRIKVILKDGPSHADNVTAWPICDLGSSKDLLATLTLNMTSNSVRPIYMRYFTETIYHAPYPDQLLRHVMTFVDPLMYKLRKEQNEIHLIETDVTMKVMIARDRDAVFNHRHVPLSDFLELTGQSFTAVDYPNGEYNTFTPQQTIDTRIDPGDGFTDHVLMTHYYLSAKDYLNFLPQLTPEIENFVVNYEKRLAIWRKMSEVVEDPEGKFSFDMCEQEILERVREVYHDQLHKLPDVMREALEQYERTHKKARYAGTMKGIATKLKGICLLGESLDPKKNLAVVRLSPGTRCMLWKIDSQTPYCPHSFEEATIKNWLTTGKTAHNNLCPMCR